MRKFNQTHLIFLVILAVLAILLAASLAANPSRGVESDPSLTPILDPARSVTQNRASLPTVTAVAP